MKFVYFNIYILLCKSRYITSTIKWTHGSGPCRMELSFIIIYKYLPNLLLYFKENINLDNLHIIEIGVLNG